MNSWESGHPDRLLRGRDTTLLRERTLETLYRRFRRQIMNNVYRAEYIECLVAELLDRQWTLPWMNGYDWAPWDLEHDSGAKLEVKQSAARQPWHVGETSERSAPRFDIAPRTGYWTREGPWIEQPGRSADIYVFAWHGESRESFADHAAPEQWEFFVVRSGSLPAAQRSIGLNSLRALVQGIRFGSLARAVTRLLKGESILVGPTPARTGGVEEGPSAAGK